MRLEKHIPDTLSVLADVSMLRIVYDNLMANALKYGREGGTIALVKEGDSVTIDAHKLLIQLNVPDAEIAARRAAWKQPAPRYTRGVLAKYAKLVGTASKGAVTD